MKTIYLIERYEYSRNTPVALASTQRTADVLNNVINGEKAEDTPIICMPCFEDYFDPFEATPEPAEATPETT
jgi:hypothetical protein